MDKKETAMMLSTLNTLYPNFKTDQPIELQIEVWQNMLEEFAFKEVMQAIKKLAYESQYPPTVHDIVSRIAQIKSPHLLDDSEAYAEMIFAVQKYGWCHQPEAMESLSPLTRKIVSQIGYLDICKSENQEALRAQFRMAYQAAANEIKQNALLPEKFKMQIGITENGNMLTDGVYPAPNEAEDLVKKYSAQLDRAKQIEQSQNKLLDKPLEG